MTDGAVRPERVADLRTSTVLGHVVGAELLERHDVVLVSKTEDSDRRRRRDADLGRVEVAQELVEDRLALGRLFQRNLLHLRARMISLHRQHRQTYVQCTITVDEIKKQLEA